MGFSAAVVGSAVVGAAASKSASDKQSSAAGKAADQSAEAAAQMRQDLSPFANAGQNALTPLMQAMGYNVDADGNMIYDPNGQLHQQFTFDAHNLANDPGYQFTMQQGLKGVQNQMANRGLGLSGAQLKGTLGYATGLADQTYGNAFNRQLGTFNTNYQVNSNNMNNLQNLVNMGQNAAAQQGQASLTGANNAGNYLTQAGNAQASGIMGVGNAANQGVQNYMLYNALYK